MIKPSSLNKLFSGTVIVTLGLLFNAFFSYLTQFYLGRKLTLEEYGTFNALLSLFYIINVSGNVLGTSIIKTVSQLYSTEDYPKLTILFFRMSLFLSSAGLLFTLFVFIFRNFLSDYFNISDSQLLVYLGIYTMANLLIVVPQSYLQGLLKFNSFALYSFLSGFLRLCSIVFVTYLGFKLAGVYIGMAVGVFLNYIISLFLLRDTFKSNGGVDLMPYYRQIIAFSIPVLLINLGMNAINNVDILMVKKFFDPNLSGFYAGVVTLGKIILFGAGAITTVMFPQISALKAANKPYMDKFLFLLFLQILVLIPLVAVFMIYPKIITLIFFGDRFTDSIVYLPRFAVFVGLYVLANFITMFFLAIDKPEVSLFVVSAVISQLFLINRIHNNLSDIINIDIVVTSLLLLSLLLYLVRVVKKEAPALQI